MSLKPRHLSLTGPNTGIRLCGCCDGPAYHATYISDSEVRDGKTRSGEPLCVDCCTIVIETIQEEENEAALAGKE